MFCFNVPYFFYEIDFSGQKYHFMQNKFQQILLFSSFIISFISAFPYCSENNGTLAQSGEGGAYARCKTKFLISSNHSFQGARFREKRKKIVKHGKCMMSHCQVKLFTGLERAPEDSVSL